MGHRLSFDKYAGGLRAGKIALTHLWSVGKSWIIRTTRHYSEHPEPANLIVGTLDTRRPTDYYYRQLEATARRDGAFYRLSARRWRATVLSSEIHNSRRSP